MSILKYEADDLQQKNAPAKKKREKKGDKKARKLIRRDEKTQRHEDTQTQGHGNKKMRRQKD